MLMVGLALALGTMSMAYIFQRDWSVRLTRAQEEQVARRRALLDVRDSLQVEIARLADLERMKQLARPLAANAASMGVSTQTVPAGSGH